MSMLQIFEELSKFNDIVVERDLNRLTWDDEQRNQLKYVAFTRASNKLNILQ